MEKLIKFLNLILTKLNIKEKFLPLNKQSDDIFFNISKKTIKKLINKTIKDILFLEISPKYKIYKEDKFVNKSIYINILKNFPKMEKLFGIKIIDIINKIYNNENEGVTKGTIDLNEYDINLIIDLNKENLETFEEYLQKKNEPEENIQKMKNIYKSKYWMD